MRLLVQAVEQATVLIHDTQEKRSIGQGILIYFGVHKDDVEELQSETSEMNYRKKIDTIVRKIGDMRWLKSPDHRLDASLGDIQGAMMVISNFTLYAKNDKGNKMSFSDSAPAAAANQVYDYFIEKLLAGGFLVQTGQFGALMEVDATTLGPINYVWDL